MRHRKCTACNDSHKFRATCNGKHTVDKQKGKLKFFIKSEFPTLNICIAHICQDVVTQSLKEKQTQKCTWKVMKRWTKSMLRYVAKSQLHRENHSRDACIISAFGGTCSRSSLHRLLVLENGPVVWGIYRRDQVGDTLWLFLLRTDILRPIRSWWSYNTGRSEVPAKLKKHKEKLSIRPVCVWSWWQFHLLTVALTFVHLLNIVKMKKANAIMTANVATIRKIKRNSQR